MLTSSGLPPTQGALDSVILGSGGRGTGDSVAPYCIDLIPALPLSSQRRWMVENGDLVQIESNGAPA